MASQSPPPLLSAVDAAACGLFPAVTTSATTADRFPDDAPVVDALGHVATAASLRAQLLRGYAGSAVAVTEAALRVDAELELLRRRCFAARNAQWGYATPIDAFDWRAAADADAAATRWHPALVANKSIALRRLRHDAAAEPRDDRDALALATAPGAALAAVTAIHLPVTASGGKRDERGVALGAFSRERAWPPRELSARAAVKPPKQRGGKRKAPAAVMEERSIFSKLCAECGVQTAPLWRKLPRDKSARGKPLKPPPTAPAAAATEAAAEGATQPPSVPMVDVCLACFLRLQRGDLFARKKAERERQARERKERAAAERLLEKKRLKQQTQQLKKQQQQAKSRKLPAADDAAALAAVAAAPAAVVKVVVLAADEVAPPPPSRAWADEEEDDDAAPVDERRSAKRDRKKSKKDKKKKKRKKRRAADSESDDDTTPLPSPPQLSGQFEYADRGGRSSRAAASFDDVDAEYEDEPLPQQPASGQEDAPRRPRKAAGRSDSVSVSVSTSAPPVTPVAAPPSSSSRKRRNSVVAAVVIPDEPARPNARAARSKTPVAAEEPPTSPVRKRARTKKESARERELRALGQYCPVCNAVYEEDDESTFVCCDSCEMWVHGSCDPSLTAASIAALAESSDKYICPMCGG